MRNPAKSTTSFCHYPRVCAVCGQPALITKETLTFETRVPGQPLTYHSECRKRRSEVMLDENLDLREQWLERQ